MSDGNGSDLGSARAQRVPAGFAHQKLSIGSVGVEYVIGGHGPTLVLLHGYPQSWYEWRHVMPRLAEHYTVIAPSLRGAGGSDAPPTGYDKKTLAGDVHGLLAEIGNENNIRLVGHDIGMMVAYAYAAAYPRDVVKLVLSEAVIPDPLIYSLPALTPNGPGRWHFGFFCLTDGLPEGLIAGNETLWLEKFIAGNAKVAGAVAREEIEVYARYLRDPMHLRATFEWFRALPQDVQDNAVYQQTLLGMPTLAIGADGSMGDFVEKQARNYASNVVGAVIADCGHWIFEERPQEAGTILLDFLNSD